MRRRCRLDGHRWRTWPPMPVQFCTRWFCGAERVAPSITDPLLYATLTRVVEDREHR